jgi:hypothetical protein
MIVPDTHSTVALGSDSSSPPAGVGTGAFRCDVFTLRRASEGLTDSHALANALTSENPSNATSRHVSLAVARSAQMDL